MRAVRSGNGRHAILTEVTVKEKATNTYETVLAFFQRYPCVRYEAGKVIFNPGDSISKVLFIVEGSVAEYDISSAGNEVVVNVFKQRSFFPMSFAINPAPNEYFFEALSPTTVYSAPAGEVLEFLSENPDVMLDLLGRVYKGTDGMMRRMAHLMGGNATSRLLFELSNASARFGVPDGKGGTVIDFTENDIAKRSGLSRETVNRTMRKLKDAGLVEISKAGILVVDSERLENTLGSTL